MSAEPASDRYGAELAASLDRPLPLTGDWSLWRLCAVRGAGFPIALLEDFVAPPLSQAIANVLDADASLGRARRDLLAWCKAQHARAAGDLARAFHYALRAVQRSRPVNLPIRDPEGDHLAAAYQRALEVVAAVQTDYAHAYAASDLEMSVAARAWAGRPDFRAAVAWQNAQALTLLERYYANVPTPGVDGAERKYRRLVASYAQRYCAKNEQIGFFGPVGWARVDGEHPRLLAGDAVVRAVLPYYEYWALAAIADRAARQDPPALRPRLSASVRIDDTGLVLPDAVLPLDAVQREFLGALDGQVSAQALAGRFAGRADTGLAEPSAVYALLAQLAANHIVDLHLPLPVAVHAERSLEAAMAWLPGAAGVQAQWHELEQQRAALAAAPLAEVPVRIANFEAAFSALAGISARRLGGSHYAGRTPLYPDALRDIELALPETVFTALAPALTPVLASAQWFSQQLVDQFHAYAVASWRDLNGGGDVPLAALWSSLQQETDTALAIGDDVVDQLQEKWRAVLDIDDGLREQVFDPAPVAVRAGVAFALTGPLWRGARFQSPDLMLAAGHIDDLTRGDWLAVLGEIHPCTNLMMQTVTGKLCPCRDAALAATARVQCEPELVPAIARDARGHRTNYSLELPHDLAIEHGNSRSSRDPAQVLRLADLWVVESGQGVQVATGDGTRQWPLMQFLGPQLRSIGISRFKPLRVASHLPRLRIGRLVLQRESWRMPADELVFTRLHDRAQRLLALRRWASRLGLPRYCFYRISGELKPYYLDFESAVFCDLFADGVRKAPAAAAVSLSEMLPTPSQSWLTDGRGRRYTAELRMAAHSASCAGANL